MVRRAIAPPFWLILLFRLSLSSDEMHTEGTMTNSGLFKRSPTFMALLIGVTFGAMGDQKPAATKPDCVDCGRGMKLCAKSISMNNNAYSIDATYPYLVEPSGAPSQAFNELVSKKGKNPASKASQTANGVTSIGWCLSSQFASVPCHEHREDVRTLKAWM